MARLRFYTLEFPLNEPGVVDTSLVDPVSLLDADVLLVSPGAIADRIRPYVQRAQDGGPWLPLNTETRALHNALACRRDEVQRLLEVGRVVFSILDPLEGYRFHAAYSPPLPPWLDNYEWLPSAVGSHFKHKIKGGIGVRLRTEPRSPMEQYCRAFAEKLTYRAYLTEAVGTPFAWLETTGNIAGSVIPAGVGRLVLLPPVLLQPEDRPKVVGVLRECAIRLRADVPATPPPPYAAEQEYALWGESERRRAVEDAVEALHRVQARQGKEETALCTIQRWRGLLYETGLRLQETVVEALNLLGFNAESVEGTRGELDIVAESPLGLVIGEVTSRERGQVPQDEVDRLHGKAAAYEVTMQAKSAARVLLANAWPEKRPAERPPHFTDGALQTAVKLGVRLVTTSDLFRAIQHVLAHREDEDFKELCRKTILSGPGGVVELPVPEG
jgi:hypothetical protein